MSLRKYRGFTLTEIIIVIVVIGLLAAALIPRLTGVQKRARDAARHSDVKKIGVALDLYYLDYGGRFPQSFSGNADDGYDDSLPRGTTEVLHAELENKGYIDHVPNDPSRIGIQARYGTGDCFTTGSNYAYYYDDIEHGYLITSVAESGFGNSSDCKGGFKSNGSFYSFKKGILYECEFYQDDITALRKVLNNGHTYGIFIPAGDRDSRRGAFYDIQYQRSLYLNGPRSQRIFGFSNMETCDKVHIGNQYGQHGNKYYYNYKVKKYCLNGEETEWKGPFLLDKTPAYEGQNPIQYGCPIY